MSQASPNEASARQLNPDAGRHRKIHPENVDRVWSLTKAVAALPFRCPHRLPWASEKSTDNRNRAGNGPHPLCSRAHITQSTCRSCKGTWQSSTKLFKETAPCYVKIDVSCGCRQPVQTTGEIPLQGSANNIAPEKTLAIATVLMGCRAKNSLRP